MPVRVQKELHRPLSQTIQHSLNRRICSRFRVIHQQVTLWTREHKGVKHLLRSTNLNKANTVAYRKNLGLGLREVSLAREKPLREYRATNE
jgi:hypothetical protein